MRNQLGDHIHEDQIREGMLASWTEQARKRVPDAIQQAWTIVVAVNERNEIQAFKTTVGNEALFAHIKGDKRSRIRETPISAEAMLPGGPYDLWREDEASRRVKDIAGAFAENPKLPKMLRQKEILDTINLGVRDGIFVASLMRPDKSVRTWWRTPVDENALAEVALELFLPDKSTLSELDPNLLIPGVLPELWTGETILMSHIVSYFTGGRTVTVQLEDYEESVAIAACPRDAVEVAVTDAVKQGVLWLVNGPASFQGEKVPPGVLTDAASLRAPMEPLSVDQLTKEAVPEAWKDGETNALALSTALSVQTGTPLPWPNVRQAIEDALSSRWLTLAPDSGHWPCEAAGAASVTLREPAGSEIVDGENDDGRPAATGAYVGSTDLEPNELQNLVDALPNVITAAAGIPIQFHLRITLGDGDDVPLGSVTSINEFLKEVSPEFRLKK